jgi:hypothetical protein
VEEAVNESGVYKHHKDGRFYQVLFVADVVYAGVRKDQDVDVFVNNARVSVAAGGWLESDNRRHIVGPIALFTARGHADYGPGTTCAVYVPLYTDKPGRRISVRAVADFDGSVFTYVGQEMPK